VKKERSVIDKGEKTAVCWGKRCYREAGVKEDPVLGKRDHQRASGWPRRDSAVKIDELRAPRPAWNTRIKEEGARGKAW